MEDTMEDTSQITDSGHETSPRDGNSELPLPGPIDIRSLTLTGLFVLAAFYTLYFAKAVFLPLILACLLSFILAPIVRALTKLKLPRAIGSAVVLLILISTLGYGFYILSGPISQWVESSPKNLRQIEYKIRRLKESIEEVSKTKQQVEKQVEEIAQVGEQKQSRIVEVEQPGYLGGIFNQTWQFGVGVVITIILLYFLLASGDLFLLKMVRVIPNLENKKKVVQIARKTERDISIYLLTITIINICLGALIGLALYLQKMPNPILWGAVAALLNFIPYVGAIVGASIVGFVALASFDNLGQIALVPATYILINGLEGYFFTPMIVGKSLTLNPVVIFFALIFWGWLWGIPGALIAVPIIVILKIICDNTESLSSLGEFLER